MIGSKRLCIDIGNNRIKLTEAAVSKSGIQLKKAAILETPENAFKDGDIKNIIVLKDVIEKGIRDRNFKCKNAVFTSNSTNIISRELVIPYTKEKNIKGIVREEMEQYLPFSLDSYVLEYINMEKTVEGIRVKVVVFPKDMAKNYYDLSNNLKLNGIALDVHSNALAKIMRRVKRINGEDVEGRNIALIDLGADSFTFTGFRHREMKFTRIMDSGLERIKYHFIEKKGMSQDDMIKALEEINLDNDAQESTDGDYLLVNEVIMDWARDIERLFNYYINSLKESVQKIYIYGGGSRIKGTKNIIGDFLGVDVDNIKELEFKDSKVNMEGVDMYINNIGASFREKR